MADGGPPKLSFAQVAQTEETTTALRVVQIDGLVALKIIKHCKDSVPQLVTGLLLGLDIGSTLEVTNCFPFPTRGGEDDEEDDIAASNFQLEMMRSLREVNVDNNTVGWYQSSYMGSYQTQDLIDTFMSYQESIKRCVCIIFDPQRSSQGVLALKALKLKDTFMDLYRAHNTASEKLRESNVTWNDIFEEIPVRLANSVLVSALMTEVEPKAPTTQADLDRLSLSTNPFLERNLEYLSECMDDLGLEQQKFQYYQRNLQRQGAQQLAWVQKRRAENAARRAAGEDALPEEDPTNPIFKPITEPSRIDSFLITNQISNYCQLMNNFAGPSLSKLYLMEAFHEQ